MNSTRSFLICFSVILLFLISCTKKVTIHETETDTVVIRQQITIRDTLYNLTNGIAAWFPFNHGSLKDSSGWHNDIYQGTATPTADRFERPGNAYLFDGTNYLVTDEALTLMPRYITVMVIIKFNGFYSGVGFQNNILLNNRYDSASNAYGIGVHPQSYNPTDPLDTTKEMFVARFGDARIADSTISVHTGTWYIVAFTYDGSHLKLYIDGELRNSKAVTTKLANHGFGLFIGECIDPLSPSSFNGVIDEIRIYDKALTGDYIRQFDKLTQ